ncbi:protein phosphatase 1 regulatory subunit 14D isoform X2 [Phascolarctos cinereus]|uniref:Protein phosphatase 1 regulatory subunit 14 n=1 Tax=Phascolarctos cinereus TaxID=38626 RepID=A0A6P5M956_PHACI|nr:protein phosphatase 1 regulatory subunit 14D isoform X2 [Phascolarctos cinereus]
MLSSCPSPCDSMPNRDPENHMKQVQWAYVIEKRTSKEEHSKPQMDSSKAPGPKARRPSRLTVKYDLGQLQTWQEIEQWVDSQLQELYQERLSSVPEFDLEDFIELSTEEQKSKLQVILQECVRPTEPFISELLSRVKKLRRLSRPQK